MWHWVQLYATICCVLLRRLSHHLVQRIVWLTGNRILRTPRNGWGMGCPRETQYHIILNFFRLVPCFAVAMSPRSLLHRFIRSLLEDGVLQPSRQGHGDCWEVSLRAARLSACGQLWKGFGEATASIRESACVLTSQTVRMSTFGRSRLLQPVATTTEAMRSLNGCKCLCCTSCGAQAGESCRNLASPECRATTLGQPKTWLGMISCQPRSSACTQSRSQIPSRVVIKTGKRSAFGLTRPVAVGQTIRTSFVPMRTARQVAQAFLAWKRAE